MVANLQNLTYFNDYMYIYPWNEYCRIGYVTISYVYHNYG